MYLSLMFIEPLIIYLISVLLICVIAVLLTYKTFEIKYENSIIKVVNTPTKVTLFVNNEVVDEIRGISFSPQKLTCNINGNEIKANVGAGLISIKCSIFVNNKKIL